MVKVSNRCVVHLEPEECFVGANSFQSKYFEVYYQGTKLNFVTGIVLRGDLASLKLHELDDSHRAIVSDMTEQLHGNI